MKRELQNMIDGFLFNKRKSKGGWAEINQDDMILLERIIQKLIDGKCEADPYGDRPIEFKLVNRHIHERIQFQIVPNRNKYPEQFVITTLNNLQAVSESLRSVSFITRELLEAKKK